MKDKFLKTQGFILGKWLPNAAFLFILSFYLLPSSKAVNNFFYIGLLAPALICINKLKWQGSFKAFNFKALYLLAVLASISLLWSPEENRKFKEFTYILYVIIFCQIIYFLIKSQEKDWLINRLKLTIVIAAFATIVLAVIVPKYQVGRLIFPTRMDHEIQLASVTSLVSLISAYFIISSERSKEKVLFIAIFLLNFYTTIKTGSRGPLLALVLALGLLLIHRYKFKALISLSSLAAILVGFIYFSLSGNSLQLNRLSSAPQQLEFTFQPKKEIESLRIRLGLSQEGEVHFNSIFLKNKKGGVLFEGNFSNKAMTLPKDWYANRDLGWIKINGKNIQVKNTSGKNFNLYHKGIHFKQPLKEITIQGSGKIQEAVNNGLICFQLTVRYQNKKIKSFNNLSRFDIKKSDTQNIQATYKFQNPIVWVRPSILIYGNKGDLEISSLKLKNSSKEIYSFSTKSNYDLLTKQWHSYSTGQTAKIENGKYILANNEEDSYSFIQTAPIAINSSGELTFSTKAKVIETDLSNDFLGAVILVKYKDGTQEKLNENLWASRFFRSPQKESRIIIWQEALKKSLDHLLLGAGISSEFNMKIGNKDILHAHNLWVSTLYKLGLIGLTLLLAAFFIKKFNILTTILIYSCICAFFDTPDLFCSSRESWLYLLIPLVVCITYNSEETDLSSIDE